MREQTIKKYIDFGNEVFAMKEFTGQQGIDSIKKHKVSASAIKAMCDSLFIERIGWGSYKSNFERMSPTMALKVGDSLNNPIKPKKDLQKGRFFLKQHPPTIASPNIVSATNETLGGKTKIGVRAETVSKYVEIGNEIFALKQFYGYQAYGIIKKYKASNSIFKAMVDSLFVEKIGARYYRSNFERMTPDMVIKVCAGNNPDRWKSNIVLQKQTQSEMLKPTNEPTGENIKPIADTKRPDLANIGVRVSEQTKADIIKEADKLGISVSAHCSNILTNRNKKSAATKSFSLFWGLIKLQW